MSVANLRKALGASALALAVCACGGGGGGGASVASIPPAPVVPPPPAPPILEGALINPPSGITSTTDFATVGSALQIRWNASAKAYEVTVPQIGSGSVVQTFFGPYGASGKLIGGDGSKLSDVFALKPYAYTGIIEFLKSPELPNTSGYYPVSAFGALTPAGAVPTAGSATYAAVLDGRAGPYWLYGSASLQFDFGAGTLSGHMDPILNGPYSAPALPRYNFTQTIYSSGSTSFSGSFDVTGPTPSSFSGRFTGPNAQELMASFQAPFLDDPILPDPSVPNWGVMEGVMIGKRP